MSQLTTKKQLIPANTGLYLQFLEGQEKGRRVPLLFTKTILGRKHGDILVRDERVSSSHIAIEYKSGRLRIVDLGSSNGTFIHDHKVTHANLELEQEVQIGQTIFCIKKNPAIFSQLESTGAQRVSSSGGLSGILDEDFIHADTAQTHLSVKVARAARPDERFIRMQISSGPNQGKRFKIKKTQVSFGRVKCDIMLDDADVSRKHCLMEIEEGGQVILRDLASSNGTYVNQVRVSNCVLQPGDQIQLGKTIIIFESAKSEEMG